MWPRYQIRTFGEESLSGTLGLFGVAAIIYAFCQNVVKGWEMPLDASVALTLFVILPTFVLMWIPVTITLRWIDISHKFISSAVSQIIIIWCIGLFISTIFHIYPFFPDIIFSEVYSYNAKFHSSVFLDNANADGRCESSLGVGCDINYFYLFISCSFLTIMASVVYISIRKFLLFAAPQNVIDMFSCRSALGEWYGLRSLIWHLVQVCIVFLLLAVLHLMSTTAPFG